MKAFVPLLSVCLLLTCAPKNQTTGKLETLVFDVSGSKEAMPSFQKGLLLLHNFEYPDAAEAFAEAQKIDNTFAMAYWGEAMSYNHPVWHIQDAEKARAALQKLGADETIRSGKAGTELEKDFLASIEILFGKGTKPERDKKYAAFMETLYKKYPGNHEVMAFYALSLLGIEDGYSKELNSKGALISEAILKENPRHPGALHYLIHSDDHPEYAKYALQAANDYSVVASYAGHALHMPSHIYLALGMWDQVVSANVVSWQASVDRKARKKLKNDALNYHGYLWLEYAYLQQGRYDSALHVLQNQMQFTRELPSTRALAHYISMKGHYLIETNNWQSDVTLDVGELKDLGLGIKSAEYLTNGLKAFHLKDKQELKSVIGILEKEIAEASKAKLANEGITICSVAGYSDDAPTQHEIDIATVMKMELQGLSAWLQNDLVDAEKWLREATLEEDKIGYFFGPPDILKPSHELYGEFLLFMNKPAEAYAEFAAVLQKSPKRTLSLKGEFQSAKRQHDEQKAAEVKKVLDEVLKAANGEVRKSLNSRM